MSTPILYDIPTLAAELCVSTDYVYAEIRAGRLRAVDIGNGRVRSKMRVRAAEVDRWVADREARAG